MVRIRSLYQVEPRDCSLSFITYAAYCVGVFSIIPFFYFLFWTIFHHHGP